jgi:sodium/potassium-transporting ATPase subunit alpha
MSSIKKLLPASALVLRDGAPHIHPVTQLVTGDVVLLNSGERVPADIRLIESHGMKIDQAALTGESEPVSSSINCTDANYLQTKNIIFFGTNILEGSGRGVVVTTGNSTVMGQIASSASRPSTNTAKMTTEIRRVIIIIAVLAGATSLAIILSWVFWLRVQYPGFMSLSQLIVTIIGVVVGFLPSGLPVCVTLSLTVIAKKMAQNHVVVKHLPTVEALGSVDVIASDKTGTLTQNKMSVVHIVTAPVRKIDCSISDKAFVSLLKDKDPIMTKLVQVLGLCNNARFEAIADDAKNVESTTGATPNAAANAAADAPRKIIGDASDTAILRFAATYLDVEAERTKWKKLFEVPFNSKNKWMLSIHGIPLDTPVANNSDTTAAIPLVSSKKAHVVIEDSSSSSSSSSSSTTNDNSYQYNEKKALLLMKGAAEMMVARCTSYLDVDGKLRAITDTFKAKIAKEQSKLGANGERVLGVCFREFEVTREFPVYDAAFDEDKDLYEVPHLDDLCFIGLVALMDPPRAEVLPAIEALHNAFVKVMMVGSTIRSFSMSVRWLTTIVSVSFLIRLLVIILLPRRP